MSTSNTWVYDAAGRLIETTTRGDIPEMECFCLLPAPILDSTEDYRYDCHSLGCLAVDGSG